MDKAEFYKDALPDSRGPLTGIRVLEATNYGAGPICGMVLSESWRRVHQVRAAAGW